jgi:hypothetical protein
MRPKKGGSLNRPLFAKWGPFRLSPFFLALALATPAAPQNRASLAGNVRDASDSAILGAAVTAWNQETGLRRTTQTSPDGRYRIDSLPAGSYKVAVRRPGFQTQVRLDFELPPDGGDLDFILQVGSIHEVVTIRGSPPLLNTSDASVSVSLNRAFAESLPLNGRGILSLVELAPGVVTTPATLGEAGQFSVSGQRQNANILEVDGVSVNSGVSGSGLPAQFSGGTLPMMTAFGSTHTLASLDEVDETRVDTSSFAPEYGRMPGGHISLTTRSGTEEFHGSLYASLRNSVFDANDSFANSRGLGHAASRLADWGATFGGPVVRNHTFFFAAYEGLRLNEPYTWNAVVPSLAARAQAPVLFQPLLAAFPVPNIGANLFGAVLTRPAALDSGTLRLDHSLTPQTALFLRVRESPSSADSGYAQVNRSRFSVGGLTLGLTAFPNASLVNDARVHVSRVAVSSDWSFTGAGGSRPVDLAAAFNRPLGPGAAATPGPALYGFGLGGIGTVYSGTSSPSRQGQLEIGDTLSWTGGSHSLRVGASYQRLTPARDRTATAVSGTSWSLQDLLSAHPLSLNISQSEQASSLIETLSAFAQDTWRIDRNLTVTYGARWELTPSPALRAGSIGQGSTATAVDVGTAPPFSPPALPPGPPPGSPPIVSPPSSSLTPVVFSSLWPTRYTQLAPRVGAAYKLSPETVVRAGWGLFYDVAFSIATDPINGFPYNRWQFSTVGGVLGAAPVAMSPALSISYAPGLRLPRTEEWNVSIEHLFPRAGTVAASYVGSHGVDGLRREGSAIPGLRLIDSLVSTNHGSSDYHALELQYHRALATGLSSTVAYTYSHSIDNGSWDNAVYYTQGPWTAASDRASSSFDVRHNFTASLVWQKRKWKVAAIARARSGFPIDVLTSENLLGLSFDDATRPDVVPGVPVWIADAHVPGGRRLNPAAFAVPAGTLEGNLGRNAIGGFGFYQVDMAISRSLPLGDRWRLDLRADAYNALNHRMPGDPVPYLDSPLFGVSNAALNAVLGTGSPHSGLAPSLQMGSPRTLQFTARFSF